MAVESTSGDTDTVDQAVIIQSTGHHANWTEHRLKDNCAYG